MVERWREGGGGGGAGGGGAGDDENELGADGVGGHTLNEGGGGGAEGAGAPNEEQEQLPLKQNWMNDESKVKKWWD